MKIIHKDLWDKVVYGTPNEALAAASLLNKYGEMSDYAFQLVFLAICYAHKTEQMTKRKKRRMD